MLITCQSCGKQLQLPDEKVPPRPFFLTCPGCKERQQVDPTAVPETAEIQPPAEDVEEAVEAGMPGPDGFVALPSLHPQEKALLDTLYPEAYLVNLTAEPSYQTTAALRLLGLREVDHYTDLEAAAEGLRETQMGVLLLVMEKVPPPPSEPLKPLHRLPPDVRRRTFVALLADDVRSLDGQVAFMLQMNCVISSQDIGRLPLLLRRALLHHLRLYRHWHDDDEMTA